MIIAQLSDTHIELDKEEDNPASSGAYLERAVNHLMSLPVRPDVVLVSGDCVNNGLPAEYRYFQALLSSLSMPVYVVPGNHDDRGHMLDSFGTQGGQALSGFMQYVIDEWPVRLIALDTHVPGQSGGSLCPERLQWLEDRLVDAPGRPTLLYLHHPPIRTGLRVLDQIGLDGADALEALVVRHPQVECVVAGHLHMAFTRRFAGTTLLTCPATDHTFLPDTSRPDRLAVQREPAACLVHVWQEHTGMLSFTSIIGSHGPLIELHDGARWLS